MELDYRAIGIRIRRLRKTLGFTQQTLAELSNQEPSNISHIERGATKLSLPTLVNIANALGVSTDMLLQDSLDVMTKPLASDASLSEHSRALLTDIVGVLREHDVSRA